MRKVLLSMTLLFLSFSSMAAQQAEQGLYPGVTYDSDVLGNIDLRTGNLAIKSTMLSLPQRKGLPMENLYLQYNNIAWESVETCDADGETCSHQWMVPYGSQPSVALSFGGVSGGGLFFGGAVVPEWVGVPLPDYSGNVYVWKWVVGTPDGSTHNMLPFGNVFRSIDGSNLVLNQTATQLIDSNGTTYSLTVPGGTLVIGDVNSYSRSYDWPMVVTNIHGQTWSPPGPFTDTLGRYYGGQDTTDYTGCTGPLPIIGAGIFSVVDSEGVTHNVAKVCSAAITVNTAFGGCHDQGMDDCEDTGDIWGVVQSIVLSPDGGWTSGNAWTFLYGRTDVSASDYTNSGMLTSIQTPQGGTVKYNWGTGIQVLSRVFNAGDGTGDEPATSYTYNAFSTVVTNPDQTSVTHSFDESSSAENGETYADQNGTTVKTVSKTLQVVKDAYNFNGSWPFFATAYPLSVTTTWPGGRTCKMQNNYSWGFTYSVQLPETGNPNPPTYTEFVPYGENASQSTYDCGNGSAGSLLSVSQRNWLDQQSSTYFNENLFGLVQQDSMYDGSGNLAAQTTYGYDEHGESGNPGDQTTATSTVIPSGGTLASSTYYSSTGNLTSLVDASNKTTTIGYDPTGIVATSTTLPPVPSGVTLSATSSIDPYSYLPTSVTDISGATTTQNYDGMLRPTTGTLGNGAATSITYLPPTSTSLATIVHTQQIDTTGTTATAQTVMDGFGRTIQSNQQTNNGTQAGWYQQDTCYDIMGRVSFTSYQYVTWSATPAAHSCTMAGDSFQYDALGRLIKTTHQDGTYSSVAYTGMATQTTDEMGVSRITQVDGLGRPTIVCEISTNASMPGSGSPGSCGTDISATGFVTSYSYNIATGKTTATQGAQTRVFQADSLGRFIYSSEPESGVTTYAYSYNSTGLQTVRTKPRANQYNSSVYTTTTTQADSVGRTIAISYANSDNQGYVTPPKVFAYDTLSSAASGSLGYSYGRMILASTGYTSTQLGGYDALGNVGTTRQCLPDWCGQSAHDVTMSYQYDLRGLMTQQQYLTQGSSGTTVSVNTARNVSGDISYVSGGQNNVSTLLDPNNNPILIQTTQLGAFGPVSGKFGNMLGIGVAYDSMGRIQGESVCTNGATSCSGASQVYAFSSLGWTGGYLNASSDSALGQSSSYGYDEFGRLKAMNIGSGTTVYSYGYDRYGNRWQQSATGSGSGPQPSLSFIASNNQLVGYTYDAAGNLHNDGFHSYLYDAEGNVVSVDCLAQYVYNASNHRVKTISSTGVVERIAFNLNGQRASTWDASGNLLTANYYAEGQQIAYYSSVDAHIHFEHQDWEGTERVRTTYTGSVEGVYASLPFGDGSSTSGADSDPYHFAQLDFDADSYTDHAEARQYSSTQGRWLSPDPYSGSYDSENPQSLNRYVYALNNPLGATDPLGLSSTEGCTEAPSLGEARSCYDGYQEVDGTLTKDHDLHGEPPKPPPISLPAYPLMAFGQIPVANVDKHGEPKKQTPKAAPNKMTPYPNPANAVPCSTSTGVNFLAPPGFSVSNIAANGATNGWSGKEAAVGQFGYYDYQRYVTGSNTFNFYYRYTPVSNIAVGAYLQGAGYAWAAGAISDAYAWTHSANGATAQQAQFRNLGISLASGKATYTCQSHP